MGENMKTLADLVVWLDSVEDPDLCNFSTPGWYFWDETQSTCYGPYETWLDCYNQLCNYSEALNVKAQTAS